VGQPRQGTPSAAVLPLGVSPLASRDLGPAISPGTRSVDPELLDRALAVSGERTKKAAVTKALQEFIARRRQKRLLELMGALEWDEGFDYKAERSRR
jgi:Bacterial antitoxin of type II TA system, VapB